MVGTPGRRGFRVEPRRRKVERTFGCLLRYRRLRVDDEASLETSLEQRFGIMTQGRSPVR